MNKFGSGYQLIITLKKTDLKINPVLKTLIDTVNNINDKPLFCPAIYDLKAKLAGKSPSDFGFDEEEIIIALEKEIEFLDLKIVTSAYDIYNIEAEAVGAEVTREGHYMPDIKNPLLNSSDDISHLNRIESPSGRMNIFINAAKCVIGKYNSGVYIRCGISGPFSMASKIYFGDKLLTDCVLNSGKVIELLDYCTKTIKIYLKGIIQNEIDVVVFDSFASPPLISPEIYRDMVFPFHKELFDYMGDQDIVYRPLILGGNSYLLLDNLINTGANSFLLDYNVNDSIREKTLMKYENSAFRINIDPSLICNGNQLSISEYLQYFLKRFGKYKNIILGTGILPYNTPLENLKQINQSIKDFF
jgi:uroporphyrinogen-III decarboxylase